MPTPKTVKGHKGITGVKTRTLSNGTKLRIYFYGDRKAAVESVKKGGKSSGAQRKGKEAAGKASGKGRGAR